jgi:hypothetical protein
MVELAFGELVTSVTELMMAHQTTTVEAPFFETIDSAASQYDFGLMNDSYSEPFVGKKFSGPKGIEEWLDFVVGLAWGVYGPMKGYYNPGCMSYMLTTVTTWVGFNTTFDKKFDTSAALALWLINPIYLLYMGYASTNKCMFYEDYYELITPLAEKMNAEDEEGEDDEADEETDDSSEPDVEDDVFKAMLKAEEEESESKDGEEVDPYFVKPKANDYLYVSIKGANVALAAYKIYSTLQKSYFQWGFGKNLAYFCTNTYLLVIIFLDWQKFVAGRRTEKVLYKKVYYEKKAEKAEKEKKAEKDDAAEDDTEEEAVEEEEPY